MLVKNIAIEITNKAFLPEASAYREFFIKSGFNCDLVHKGNPNLLNYDCVLLFHGFHPFWKKYPKKIIGEYHTLSTGRLNRVKDFLKRVLNVRSDLYVFLNEDVRKNMWFSTKINYAVRGMGYSRKEFSVAKDTVKEFDVVYCGSYRDGLYSEIERLADIGITIALVGPEKKLNHKNVFCFGRLPSKEARKLIFKAKYGLNITPDIFPFNIQDSTKVIEYSAAGLGVITNRYRWVNEFERERGAAFLTIDNIRSLEDLESFCFVIPEISDLEWHHIMDRCGIFEKIEFDR